MKKESKQYTSKSQKRFRWLNREGFISKMLASAPRIFPRELVKNATATQKLFPYHFVESVFCRTSSDIDCYLGIQNLSAAPDSADRKLWEDFHQSEKIQGWAEVFATRLLWRMVRLASDARYELQSENEQYIINIFNNNDPPSSIVPSSNVSLKVSPPSVEETEKPTVKPPPKPLVFSELTQCERVISKLDFLRFHCDEFGFPCLQKDIPILDRIPYYDLSKNSGLCMAHGFSFNLCDSKKYHDRWDRCIHYFTKLRKDKKRVFEMSRVMAGHILVGPEKNARLNPAHILDYVVNKFASVNYFSNIPLEQQVNEEEGLGYSEPIFR